MVRLIVGMLVLPLACGKVAAQALPSVDPVIDQRVASARAQVMSNPQGALEASIALREDLTAHARGRDQLMGLAEADWVGAAALLSLNRPHDAMVAITQALNAVTRAAPNSTLRGELILAHGRADETLGRLADALRNYQRAFQIFNAAGEPRGKAVALQQIGAIYSSAGDYENALRYGQDAVETYAADPVLLLSGYNNNGNALTQLGRYRDAEAAYQRALNAARKMGNLLLETRVLGNLARAEAYARDYDAADATLVRAFAIARSGPAANWRPALFGVAAEVALRRHQLDRAASLIAQTFGGAHAATGAMPMRDFHHTAYQIYRALGDEPRALEHLEAFKRLDDEARTLTASTNAALMSARFDFSNQNLRISDLKKGEAERDATIANARARFLIALLAAAAVISTLLAIGFISIRRSRNQVRAANATLRVTNTELGKALAAKTEFLATTSHEIRTPLNGILGMTQVILADPALAPLLRGRIELVHGAGETMRALVDDILDVAKMETGELVIHPGAMDLRRLLHDAAQVWEGQAQTKGIGIALDIAECPPAIVADETRLRQIVFNLMSNAIKFTDRGAVRLAAAAVPGPDGERLRIDVIDSGIGIPADRIGEIFESFRQIDGGTTRRHGGTGLGLTICRNLARAMGGDILVASTDGAGSTFTIDIPLERSDMGVAAPAALARAGGRAESLATAGLLLVEGNPLSQGILRALLTPHVGRLHVVPNADEAASALTGGGIDHLVTDGATIALDAAQAERLARAAAAAGARMTLLWPAPGPEVVAAAAQIGAQLIAKPIGAPDLLAALQMVYSDDVASRDMAA